MNAAAIRVLFDYNAWAHAQVWEGVGALREEQFTEETGYSVGSLRNHLVHLASVDARWFARVRGSRLPDRLDPNAFTTREEVGRLWSVVYNDLGDVLERLTDEDMQAVIEYSARGESHAHPTWKILLHVLNHATDHRAQMLYALNKLGVQTPEQDFAYYLRDELPPRGTLAVSKDVLVALFEYDAYATSRLVSECLADLTEEQLDHDFGYSHGTVRAQLAHLMMSTQYWLERAYKTEIPGTLSALLGAGVRLTASHTDAEMVLPVEYRTSRGVAAANNRWEMLWQLINHGTDHRAQTLAFLAELNAETFEQDMMIYFWEYES